MPEGRQSSLSFDNWEPSIVNRSAKESKNKRIETIHAKERGKFSLFSKNFDSGNKIVETSSANNNGSNTVCPITAIYPRQIRISNTLSNFK
ncbi:MAG: hypothetical protein QM763_21570 [Agriterribacter sp.]